MLTFGQHFATASDAGLDLDQACFRHDSVGRALPSPSPSPSHGIDEQAFSTFLNLRYLPYPIAG